MSFLRLLLLWKSFDSLEISSIYSVCRF